MAYIKVTEMTADTTPTYDDLLMVVNAPGATPGSRKVTIADLSKALGWVDVRAYGAVGDGTTNCTTPFQNAINSLTNGGIVFIPQGSYLITPNTLTIPVDIPIGFKGVGANHTAAKGTEFKLTVAAGYLFNLTAGGNIVGFSMEDIRITGNSTNDGFFLYTGQYGFNWTFRKMYITGFTKSAAVGFNLTDCSHILIDSVQCEVTNGYGIKIQSSALDTGMITIIHSNYSTCATPFYSNQGSGAITHVISIGCLFDATTYCVDIVSGSGIEFYGCNFQIHSVGPAIVIDSGQVRIHGGGIFGDYTTKATKGIHLTGAVSAAIGVEIDGGTRFHLDTAGTSYCVYIENSANITQYSVRLGYLRAITATALLYDPGYKAVLDIGYPGGITINAAGVRLANGMYLYGPLSGTFNLTSAVAENTAIVYNSLLINQGDLYALTNGKGIVLKNAAGSVQKRVRLNDAGDGLIYEAP